MKRNLPAIILRTVCTSILCACSSGPPMILESDIPAPPEMEGRHSANIDQRSGALDGGLFTFRGPMNDVVIFTNEMVSLFQEQGWSVYSREVNTTSGKLIFEKGARQVEVNFRAGQLNPSMSEATLIVRQIQSPVVPRVDPSASPHQ